MELKAITLKNMAKLLKAFWQVVKFPFIVVYQIISLPVRAMRNFLKFLNTEPDEQPVMDTLAGVVSDEKVRQQLWGQIDTLRSHLLRAIIWLVIGTGVSFAFTQLIVNFLALPVGGLDQLKSIEVTESIGVFMRVALLSGTIISLPLIIFELWWFVAPGLRPRERKFALVGIPLATIFFIGGVTFAYFVLLPTALPFLLNFMGIQAELRPNSYFAFVTGLMFWMGVSFEFPLVIYFLTSIGFIQPRILTEQWRLAVIIIAIFAAAVTPTIDPVNMGLVMLPMILLYFVSIGLSYIAYAGRQRHISELETSV